LGDVLNRKKTVNKSTKMWDEINEDFLKTDKFNISSFRQPGELNSRLASWEPGEKSLRWYRSFLNLAYSTSSAYVQSNLQNTLMRMNLGDPISNKQNGSTSKTFSFNLDYLLAFEEMEYLEKSLEDIYHVKNIIEIGAGFGRTAHVIIEKIAELDRYVIFDLPEMLEVSSVYLETVLEESQFKKITFTSSIDFNELSHFDLAVQIDGFQEMSSETINSIYLNFLSVSNYVYLKNPIGKYLPESAGLEVELLNVPLALGRSLDVLDIWNLSELEDRYIKHLDIYRPEFHQLLNAQPDRLFPHYMHSIYRRD
jgi:putative sugar O-methyltransferase